MGISMYSLISAIIFFNVGLLIVKLFRRNTAFLIQNRTIVLVMLLFLSLIRLFFPLDLDSAAVISSKNLLPAMIDVLQVSVYKGLSLGGAILLVWAAGTVVTVCRWIYRLRQEVYRIKKFRPIKDAHVEKVAKACLPNQVTVIVSPDVDVPKATGIRHAYIYLPPLTLSDEDLKLVLLHECQHVKNKDIVIKLFYLCLKAVFWWNPVVYIFHNEVDNLLELRCDSAVTKGMSEKARIAYLEAILTVIKQSAIGSMNHMTSATPLVSLKSQGFTQQRFAVILNKVAGYSKSRQVAAICLIVFTFFASYFVIIQPEHDAPDLPGGQEYVEVIRDNAYITVDKNGVMELYIDGVFWETVDEDELDMPPCSDLEIVKKENLNE